MAALNRRTVTTDVQKEFQTNFIDINKAVGLISDTAVITTLKKLYTTLEEVGADFATTSEAYTLAKAYFDDGGTILYLVPVTGESSGTLTTIAIDVNDFISITDGTFDLTINGAAKSALTMNFTADTSVTEIAATINAVTTPLGASASVGVANSIVFTSLTTGLTSLVATMAAQGTGTDISVLLAEASTTSGDKDITGKLTELENDSDASFNFVVCGMDKALSVTKQVVEAVVTQYVFNKEYQMHIDTTEAAVLTGVTTDIVSVNKAFYDNLSGDNLLRLGNTTFYYTDVATDFVSFGVMGLLMSKDIGAQTVKFMKPVNSDAVSMTNAELTNALNKQANVYTGTNERVGRSFVKEGLTLKDGDYIDTGLGSIWIKVQLEENIYNLLQTKKVPINQNGFDELKTTTTPVFDQAIAQGIINGFGEGSYKFNGNDAASIITGGYDINFRAGDVQNREIIGEYVYFEEIAGHFVTNTVVIKTEA